MSFVQFGRAILSTCVFSNPRQHIFIFHVPPLPSSFIVDNFLTCVVLCTVFLFFFLCFLQGGALRGVMDPPGGRPGTRLRSQDARQTRRDEREFVVQMHSCVPFPLGVMGRRGVLASFGSAPTSVLSSAGVSAVEGLCSVVVQPNSSTTHVCSGYCRLSSGSAVCTFLSASPSGCAFAGLPVVEPPSTACDDGVHGAGPVLGSGQIVVGVGSSLAQSATLEGGSGAIQVAQGSFFDGEQLAGPSGVAVDSSGSSPRRRVHRKKHHGWSSRKKSAGGRAASVGGVCPAAQWLLYRVTGLRVRFSSNLHECSAYPAGILDIEVAWQHPVTEAEAGCSWLTLLGIAEQCMDWIIADWVQRFVPGHVVYFHGTPFAADGVINSSEPDPVRLAQWCQWRDGFKGDEHDRMIEAGVPAGLVPIRQGASGIGAVSGGIQGSAYRELVPYCLNAIRTRFSSCSAERASYPLGVLEFEVAWLEPVSQAEAGCTWMSLLGLAEGRMDWLFADWVQRYGRGVVGYHHGDSPDGTTTRVPDPFRLEEWRLWQAGRLVDERVRMMAAGIPKKLLPP